MKKYFLLITLTILTIVLFSVASIASGLETFKEEKGILRISGGTAHIPVMQEAAKRIMTFNPAIQIIIAGGGSGAGIRQVGEELVNIGNSGREVTRTELEKYSLVMYKWAVDGVAAVVNPANKVTALSTEQLQDIFAGRILNWQELKGENRPINVYTRDNSSGTRAVFWKKGLQKAEISGRANFLNSNGAMKSAVHNDPYAIGYVSVGFIDQSVVPVILDGVKPTFDTVKSGEYKIARGLYSNTKGKATGLAGKFIDYLLSSEGQKIVMEKGFIPVN